MRLLSLLGLGMNHIPCAEPFASNWHKEVEHPFYFHWLHRPPQFEA